MKPSITRLIIFKINFEEYMILHLSCKCDISKKKNNKEVKIRKSFEVDT